MEILHIKRGLLLLALGIVFLDAGSVRSLTNPRTVGLGNAAENGRGMWVWNDKVIDAPSAVSELLGFASSKRIKIIYLFSERVLQNDQANLAGFIAAADTQGIKVELLFGEPEWALTANQARAVDFVRMSTQFSQSLGKVPKPAGLHFDVEPQSLSQWTADRPGVAAQYVNLLTTLQNARGFLPLGVDYPFGNDSILLTRSLNGVPATRSLSAWVISIADEPVLMDYRNYASPPDGMIDHAQASIDYAAKIGKRVMIGVETGCDATPAKVTFCGKGAGYMESQLAATANYYGASTGFGGFAIHDYIGYRALAQ